MEQLWFKPQQIFSGDNTTINRKDVLAVYALRTTSNKNSLDVITLDDKKIDILCEIMKDINIMTGVATPRFVAEKVVTTDEEGSSVVTTQYVTNRDLMCFFLLSNDEMKNYIILMMNIKHSLMG